MGTRNVSARLAICMAVLSLLCIGCVRSAGVHKDVGGDDMNENYARFADQLMKTIKNKDVKGFLDLTTLPESEARAVLENEFKTKESGLSIFYSAGNSRFVHI